LSGQLARVRHDEAWRQKTPRFVAKPRADQASTLFFLNQATIWFQASSAASLR
jgi:hypothetical protein